MDVQLDAGARGWRVQAGLPQGKRRIQLSDGWYLIRDAEVVDVTVSRYPADTDDALMRIACGDLRALLRLEVGIARDTLLAARMLTFRFRDFLADERVERVAASPAVKRLSLVFSAVSVYLRSASGVSEVCRLANEIHTVAGDETVTVALSQAQRAILREQVAAAEDAELFIGLRLSGGRKDFAIALAAAVTLEPGEDAAEAAARAAGATVSDPKVSGARAVAAAKGASPKKGAAQPPSPVVSQAKAHYDRRDYMALVAYTAALSPVDPGLEDYVLSNLYTVQILLQLNASASALDLALRLYEAMAAVPERDEKLFRRAMRMVARCQVRAGAVDEAVAMYRRILVENPFDWETYFLLGANTLGLSERIALYAAGRRLRADLPRIYEVALIETFIEAGDLERALTTLLDIGRDKGGITGELVVTQSNLFGRLFGPQGSAGLTERFFAQYGLLAPVPGEPSAGNVLLSYARNTVRAPRFSDGVTVVMTAFNAADTIRMAVRSILDQTHENLQVCIVEDCSTDDTRDVIAALCAEDPRVRALHNETNSGTYVSKNRGMAEVSTPFVTFHDSDDWMHPERIERHLEAMHEDEGVMCSTSLWYRAAPDGYVLPRRTGGYLHDNPASTFFRKAVIEACGYFDSVRTGADSEMMWRVRSRFGSGSVKKIPLPLAIGLHHDHSLTTSGAAAFDEHRFSAVRLRYWESWLRWHLDQAQSKEELYIPFPLPERRFACPVEISVEGVPASAA